MVVELEADSSGIQSSRRVKKFLRHPVFPLVVFILACQVTGEFYPFSAFSMYSNPSSRPMRLYYLADAEGNALPMTTHTGSSPARMTKKFNRHKGDLEDSKKPPPDEEIRARAGNEVLIFLRELSLKRSKKRQLRDSITLVQLSITSKDGEVEEEHKIVARLEAMPEE